MEPLDFLRDNVFYTKEKIRKINEAQQESAAGKPNYSSMYGDAVKRSTSQPQQKKPEQKNTNFLQDNIFYTDEKTKEINKAQQESAAINRKQRTPTPAKPEPKPQSSEPYSRRSRYSSGKPGGYGSPDYVSPESTSSSSRRGGGVRGRDNQTIDIGKGFSLGSQIGRGTKSTSAPETDYNKLYGNALEGSIENNPVRPSQPPTPDQGTPLVEETTAIVADETRLNGNGMVQKGRNMSSLSRGDDNMPYIQGEGGLLDRVGLGADAKLNSGWASNQLPGTDTSLYGGKPVTQGFDSDGMGINTGAERQSLSKNLYADGGAVTFEEGQNQSVSGLSKESSIGVEAADGRPSIFKDARSRAFLDAPSSMAGMRAVDAQLGRVRAGGDYHYTNPNAGDEGESEFIKVSTETGRAHQNGQISGQEILAKHMDRVIQNGTSETQFNPDEEIDY